MVNKKGQAAMEFLMTYGWAILAAVIAIGVLAYFGVFSPQNSLPNICNIGPPMGCVEHQVNDTGVLVRLHNGVGSVVNVTNFVVSGCGSTSTIGNLADGADLNIFLGCDSATTVGAKFNGDITVSYLAAGKTIIQTATGQIRSTVVAA